VVPLYKNFIEANMRSQVRTFAIISAAMCASVGACTFQGDSTGSSTTIVTGPNGAEADLPSGVDTTVSISIAESGYPPLPTGYATLGDVYAFTPHGLTFGSPATIHVPFAADHRRAATSHREAWPVSCACERARGPFEQPRRAVYTERHATGYRAACEATK
jgi:hypothetical protein